MSDQAEPITEGAIAAIRAAWFKTCSPGPPERLAAAVVSAVRPLIEQQLRDRIVADLRRNQTSRSGSDNDYQLGYSDGYWDAIKQVEKSRS